MHDRHDHDRMNGDAGLAAALRALPAASPPHDAWPLLAARARRRKHGWRIAIPAALAAALALAIVLPDRPARNTATTPATMACAGCGKAAPDADAEAAAQAWRTRSQRLQAWVHELDDGGAPLGGVALARAAELEDQIGLVDLQLGAGADTATQATLWHQRVVLLEALAMVRLSPSALATSDPRAIPDAIPVGARVD